MKQSDDFAGPVFVASARTVRLGIVAEACTGLTKRAMERKIENGEWQEGREWWKAPDGRRYIDLDGFERWVRGE